MEQKKIFHFSWFAAILASLIPVTWEMIWTIYNTYVPLYLQGGNPAFEAGMGVIVVGFGLGPALTGFIMAFDNIAALFIEPVIAAWSDSMRTRWGRRKPFFMVGTPLILVGFIAIPVIAGRIPGELSGQVSELMGLFIPFLIAVFLVLFPLALVKAPSNVLLFDITPSRHRGTVYGIANSMAGFMAILVGILGSTLYAINMNLPFIVVGFFSLLCVLLVWLFVREPETAKPDKAEKREVHNIRSILHTFKTLPKEYSRSLLFLSIVDFLAFFGSALIQAFGSSLGMTVLKMTQSTVILLPVTYAVSVMIFSVPVALLGNKLSRKKVRIIGFAVMIVITILQIFIKDANLFLGTIVIFAAGWAATNVNATPMFIDSAPSDDVLATYQAIEGVAQTLGMIIGPILGGILIQALGGNYLTILPMMAVSFVIAIFCLRPVTKGEIRIGN